MKLTSKALIAAAAVVGLTITGAGYAAASSIIAPKTPTAHHVGAAPQSLDSPSNTQYVPSQTTDSHSTVPACTVFSATALSGHTRSIGIRGTASLHSQGGSSTGCQIPRIATSVDAIITITAGSHSGTITWKPASGTTYRVMSYPHSQTTTVTTTLQMKAGSVDGTLENNGSSSPVKIVVIGYDKAVLGGMVYGTGASVYAGASGIASVTRHAVGSYTVHMTQDVSYCTPAVMGYSQYVYASAYGFDGTDVQVYMWTLNSSTHVESPYDGYFYITVMC